MVSKITEIVGMDGEQIQTQDIFEYVQTGISQDGTVAGHFRSTGIRSRFFERLIAAGIAQEDILFEQGRIGG